MAKDLSQEEVLIARNNDTGQVGAVTGLNEDGTPRMTDVKSAKLSDLVKFSKGQNPLEAFMSNFVRQCKNPSTFGFFRVPADRYDTVGTVIGDLAKDPVANAEMLKNNVVDVPLPAQKVDSPQEQKISASEEPKGDAVAEEPANAEKEAKYRPVDESRIDWDTLKEKWGIDREALKQSGDLQEMLYNRKSKPVNLTMSFAGEKYPVEARLSFRTDPDGNVKVVPHFIHHEAKLDQDFMGHKFSKIDKANLIENGNLGRIVDLIDPVTGEKIPSFVSRDRYTNELIAIPAKSVYVRDTFGQSKLTMAEIAQLKQGKPLPPKEVLCRDGKTRTGIIQYNTDRRNLEFVPGGIKWWNKIHGIKEETTQSESAAQEKAKPAKAQQRQKPEKPEGEKVRVSKENTWLLEDGRIKPLHNWKKHPLTEEQTREYAAGRVAVITDMPDEKGQPTTVYLQFDKNRMKPEMSLNDPRVKVAEESKTQKAVNNDGLTNEATKHVAEPLQKYQTEPKNEAQAKQQRKPKGPKM